MKLLPRPRFLVLGLLLAACSSEPATTSAPGSGPDKPLDPGTPQSLSLSAEQQQEQAALQAALTEAKQLDAKGFAAKYAVPFSGTNLGYDPLTAQGMNLVQSSSLALDAQEQAALAKGGFVVSGRKTFPSFVYGYESIYALDLPVFVSADSILYAVHESYDALLESTEQQELLPALQSMLTIMRDGLTAGAGAKISAAANKDADLYLSVALSLLTGKFQAPMAGADAKAAEAIFQLAAQASGAKQVVLFDVARDVDFSQFQPRGHYTDSPELSRYFQAMIWLGRIDLRLLETQDDGSQIFRRRQLEAAYVLAALMNDTARKSWKKLDDVIGAFVGEAYNMTVSQLDALLSDLSLSDATELQKVSDAALSQAIVDGGYGTQRISSHIMINGLNDGTLPLSSNFLLLGQRYVVDSHVFSNVVYDRVAGGSVKRMMPNPLDVGFAALGNDQAGMLLGAELQQYPYAGDLAAMRVLVDAHPESTWQANLYGSWLSALRTLSPRSTLANASGLPTVASSDAWGRRLLNTQLASWAELRHDTILYAKQSYTGGASCDFPDAYVEPYPEFYLQLRKFAERGQQVLSQFSSSYGSVYFTRLAEILTILQQMAENQRSGTPHSAEHLAFINQAVKTEMGCGEPVFASGWYRELFYRPGDAIEFDPVVADVHTQPTDEAGTPVGRVLHVGTGSPRLMVVTAENCSGPRAYVGLVSSYFEKVTENYERLTDETWASDLQKSTPTDVPWLQNLVVR